MNFCPLIWFLVAYFCQAHGFTSLGLNNYKIAKRDTTNFSADNQTVQHVLHTKQVNTLSEKLNKRGHLGDSSTMAKTDESSMETSFVEKKENSPTATTRSKPSGSSEEVSDSPATPGGSISEATVKTKEAGTAEDTQTEAPSDSETKAPESPNEETESPSDSSGTEAPNEETKPPSDSSGTEAPESPNEETESPSDSSETEAPESPNEETEPPSDTEKPDKPGKPDEPGKPDHPGKPPNSSLSQ